MNGERGVTGPPGHKVPTWFHLATQHADEKKIMEDAGAYALFVSLSILKQQFRRNSVFQGELGRPGIPGLPGEKGDRVSRPTFV